MSAAEHWRTCASQVGEKCDCPRQADAKLQQENSAAPRTYTVGVPLVVTVHDDGRVTYEVDLSEVTDEMAEQSEYPADVISADEVAVQVDVDHRYATGYVHMVDAP